MMYKDELKAKEASRARMRRYRERQGVTEQGVTVLPDVTPTSGVWFVDGTGVRRGVGFSGRRAAWDLLEGWSRGEGDSWQYKLGRLAQVYGRLRGGYDEPIVLANYLGIGEGLAVKLLAGRGSKPGSYIGAVV